MCDVKPKWEEISLIVGERNMESLNIINEGWCRGVEAVVRRAYESIIFIWDF